MWNKFEGTSGTAAPGAMKAPGAAGARGWHPTVLYMIGLLVLEMVVLGFISHHLLK